MPYDVLHRDKIHSQEILLAPHWHCIINKSFPLLHYQSLCENLTRKYDLSKDTNTFKYLNYDNMELGGIFREKKCK